MQIALAQHQVGLACHLDLVGIVRAEQHPVAELDRTNMLPDAGDLAPDQALGDLGGGGDQDAAAAGAFPAPPTLRIITRSCSIWIDDGESGTSGA